MPYRVFNLDEVARYLHLSRGDVERLVKDRDVPFEIRGDRPVFRKQEIDAWFSQRILNLREKPLAEYHQKSSQSTREIVPNAVIMPELIQLEYIDPAMKAKTRASVIRDLASLAEKTGRVNDVRDLIQSLEEREELCSTGLPGGLALVHPRHHQPYMFESSFIAVGRPLQPIHFGAPDGLPTDLFLLICCQDDRLHLHTLARICVMAVKTALLEQLRLAPDAAAMHECILRCEEEALGRKPAATS